MSEKLKDLLERRDTLIREGNALTKELSEGKLSEDDYAAKRDRLREISKEYDDVEPQVKELEGDVELIERFANMEPEPAGAGAGDGGRSRGDGSGRYRGANGPRAAELDALRTPGQAFVESPAYKGWLEMYPDGGPPVGADGVAQVSARSNAVTVGSAHYRSMLGIQTPTEKAIAGSLSPEKFRSLVTAADASAGLWVRPEYRGLIEPGMIRPLTVRNLVTTLPTSSDAIEYMAELTRLSTAAPVTEAVQIAHTGDTTATKAEGGLTFQLRTDVVKQIALWVPVTNRVLSDAPQLRNYIDQYLTDDISIELEDQMVSGTGGAGFTGIFNTSGTQTLGPPAGALTELDLLRRAKRLVVTNARTRPTAILANPEDSERWDILKAGTNLNNYAWQQGAPQGDGLSSVWGLPIIESEACPLGFALVGDFRRAVLFDREAVRISVGTAGDDFIRNIVRILAEMRAGFGVLRPAAFVEVDLVP